MNKYSPLEKIRLGHGDSEVILAFGNRQKNTKQSKTVLWTQVLDVLYFAMLPHVLNPRLKIMGLQFLKQSISHQSYSAVILELVLPHSFHLFLLLFLVYVMQQQVSFTRSRPVVLSLMSSGRRMNMLSSFFTYGSSMILNFMLVSWSMKNVSFKNIICTGLVLVWKKFGHKNYLTH